ncbi:sensor histidine kinase [Clostridium folliculivorans]|uniref:histidine kinase n=1 Tax=Clostridium folliculivorans TaxID=2886038 RepID=A0A9W5Y484_9CLOT|nr:histidine kinase [Clostridium folliculivorans]GKU26269.1 two-component sensor histidine kinase [Clostridium folliculivorans]GKU31941.1 two-component sensor histidine kinase [Clostridium folliculivorans]
MKNRSDYLLILRALIIIYCVYDYIEEKVFSTNMVILLLIYIITSVLYFVLIKYKNSIIIPVTSIIVILYSSIYINNLFIVLLPCSIYDIINAINLSKIIFSVVSLVMLIIMSISIQPIYVFIVLLIVMLDSIFTKHFARIDNLLKENDFLREKNYNYTKEIDDLKSYEKQVLYTTQVEERNSLSQKMHDKVGHTIAASLMQLEAAKFIMKSDKDKAEAMIDNSIRVLRDGMDDIRITLRKIKPPTEQLGINRVKMALEDCTKGTELKYSLIYTGDLNKIKYSHWIIIIESIKESLTNTIKYSNASNVEVAIDVLNKVIRVFVKDNGLGIVNVKKGLGLSGIEQRCIDAGGNALFDGSDGFAVTLLLPILKEREHEYKTSNM